MYESIQTTKDKTGEKENARKTDTYQTWFESIQKAKDEGWYDSNYFESSYGKSESLYDTIQA